MSILNPGYDLTLRPMKYPELYSRYKDAIKNTWTIEEIDFSRDIPQLRLMSEAEKHMVKRLVAFFSTGDSIVSNNLVINLYRAINSPEARMYLSRQLFEEANHVDFYLRLLDVYIPDHNERNEMFRAVEAIPSIKKKAEWMQRHIDVTNTPKNSLYNIIAFACCVEGLFFFGAFAYVYFLRSRGLLTGLADGTNWVFRDECVSPETEVLTEHGWKNVVECSRNPVWKIYQVDSEQKASLVTPERWLSRPYRGPMYNMSTPKNVSFCVTENHDVVTWTAARGLHKSKAKDLCASSIRKLPTTSVSDAVDTFSDLDAFAVAFQADGHRSKRHSGVHSGVLRVSFSLTKERKKARIKALLESLDWDFSTGARGPATTYTVRVPVAYEYLCRKDFSGLRLQGGQWGRDFIQELQYWDGYTAGDRKCIQYTNTNEAAVDFAHAVASLSGYTATKYRREDRRKESYKDVFNLFLKDRLMVNFAKTDIEAVPYDGWVYCPTVPTGMFLIRHNGKVCVTGNCGHMEFAFSILDIVRRENPELWESLDSGYISQMIQEAVDIESEFAKDTLSGGIAGLNATDMRTYLEFCADLRLQRLGFTPHYNVKNPFPFMEQQGVQTLANFFERRVSDYQTNVSGEVRFDEEF